MFEYYSHLGFNNPYFIWQKDKIVIEEKFSDIISKKGKIRELDLNSVIQILARTYMFGNRTIVKGIYKTPWMAKPNGHLNGWEYFKVPLHENKKLDIEFIAKELFELLQAEILEYIGNSKNIGVLLSGGMDSRIMAGTIDYLIKQKTIKDISVKAFTWGNPNSRDVIYSKEIAKRFDWEWKHFLITPESLIHNIELVADQGCEYTPIHLHAMPQIKQESGLDCILAGSFGDGIGRAEYEGVKVINLENLYKGFRNFGSIIKSAIYENYNITTIDDLRMYHKLFPRSLSYQRFEQDCQIHYMRRKLNPCMTFINETTPVYQIFTNPNLFGFMWSLDPENRTDHIYNAIIRFFKTDLRDIPWSRTGLKYNQTTGEPDNYSQKNHSYPEIINTELFNFIKDRVLSSNIERLGIFNRVSLISLLNLLKVTPKDYNIAYGERLCWIASLAIMVEKYDVTQSESYPYNIKDCVNGLVLSPGEFILRNTKEALMKLR